MKVKTNINNFLFYFSYFLLMISNFCGKVIFLSNYLKYFKILAIGLLLIKCIIQDRKYTFKSFIKILLLILTGFLSYFKSGDESILILFLSILASRHIIFDDFVEKDFKFKIILVIILMLLHFLGLTNDVVLYRYGTDIARNSFGFSHPNIFGIFITMISIEFIYIHRNKFKYIYLIPLFAVVIFIIYYTDSRASALLLILFIIYCLFSKTLSKFFDININKKVFTNIFLILTILSFIMAYLYRINNQLGIILNELFTTRIQFIDYYLNNYNITLFGTKLLLISSENAKLLGVSPLILDNLFAYLLLRYGLVSFLIIMIFYNKSIKIAYKHNNKFLVAILVLLAIYGLMEKYPIHIVYNCFIIYFSNVLYGDKESDKND